MNPVDPGPASVTAAENNASWCDAVCRSHGIPTAMDGTAWSSPYRTPPYYPDAVTLSPGADPADILGRIDTTSPGCSVKDSFADLDLTPHGFAELFAARWIHCRPKSTPDSWRTEEIVDPAHLSTWQTAWHGGGTPPDLFRPPLLSDPSVLVLSVHNDKELSGGFILNQSKNAIGLSNLFAVDETDLPAIWSSASTAAAHHFPGIPLVGYQRGRDLTCALAVGFIPAGPLRVWMHAF